jgi:hypothetical protein
LGTVKNTTGTTAGLIRNTGATIVAQSNTLPFNFTAGGTVCALPAGAMITDISLITTTAYTGGTTPSVTLSVNGTAITAALSLGTAGKSSATIAATTAAAGLINNVGTSDVLVTATIAGGPTAGSGTLVVQYVVRAEDGSSTPAFNVA